MNETHQAQRSVVIAGGSGFLGTNLARHLAGENCNVVLLSRNKPTQDGPWTYVHWDARTLGDWASHIDGADAVVNLAGRTVDCVKTPDHCDEILRSRVEATTVLGQAVCQAKSKPPVWVQMGTAHIYGDAPKLVCDESSAFGYGLAPTVGRAWEDAFEESCPDGVRKVVLRTSFVLGRDGGAMTRLAGLARWGLGGPIASGRQGMSWIHIDDMNRIFERAITNDTMQGAYIATAPNPASNREFMAALRKALGKRIGLPATAWMVRIGAPLLLRTDPELAIYGRYCVPKRLLDEGFEFTFSEISTALQNLYRAGS
ncbi:MAG: TIGR01777 family protein [Phycisphaeraceae bacterium]|nr:TIGR01777 family oxidoreductase [Phycisphaerales bacterium]MCB9861537.1 TIGR01777 family protein [Phycisphaeraceae bacterium]